MIKVTVELYPYGYDEGKRTIGEAVIYNDGTGTIEKGSYKGFFVTTGRDNNQYRSELQDFERKNDVWQLIHLMLLQMSETEEIPPRVRDYLHSQRR